MLFRHGLKVRLINFWFIATLTCNSPYKFEAPWSAWEFAYHILHKQANLVILSMAWLTREDARSYSRAPKEPDMETLSYWLARLEPLIREEGDDEIIIVLANRCGTEGEVVYAGTSAVLGIQGGEVKVYGILGRGEKELLIVDTDVCPQAKLISEPKSDSSAKGQHRRDPDTRTNSAVSDRSLNSVLSADTQNTACTTPNPDDTAMGMEDAIGPISPVDPISPQSYFAPAERKGDVQILKSNTHDQQESKSLRPSSPTLRRPESPKSRNASRSRQPVTQEPALATHDLAQEPQVNQRSSGVNSPLQSAPPVPNMYQSGYEEKDFGPRSAHTPVRPRSVIW